MFDTPGVYIREIPSGNRAIAGVATSNTAFVGTFSRGPVNEAVRVSSYGEFERIFGGLHDLSESSYVIRSYFQNGGSVAFIVRVTAPAAPVAATQSSLALGDLVLTASSAGVAGNRIRAGVIPTGADTFTLLIRQYNADFASALPDEVFTDVSINAGPNFVDTIVNAGSALVTAALGDATLPPTTQIGGADAANVAALQGAGANELEPFTGGADLVSPPSSATGAAGSLSLTATSEGAWGDQLRVGVAHAGSVGDTRFTLLVREYDADLSNIVREEAFIDVSITEGDARYVESVLADSSELISGDLTAVALPLRSNIGGSDATDLDALLDGTAGDFTALAGGSDGTMEGDGGWDAAASVSILGTEGAGSGIYALNAIVPEVFNLMCLPGAANIATRANSATIYQEAYTFCRNNLAFLVIDSPPSVDRSNMQTWLGELGAAVGPNAALYYPRVSGPDPLNPQRAREIGAAGMAAGLMARTDGSRGVWKAPAGIEARVSGGSPVDVMTDRQQGPLNTSGVNVIRTFPVYNSVIWGARTLDGADARASEWRYINVRRLALFIENSLQRGLQWVVFEPNDEPLWANVRMTVGGFMNQLHRQGAFQGASARDAYLVKCDSETTTQADINLGILNVYVGFAPVRPAEFVIIRIQQRFPNA